MAKRNPKNVTQVTADELDAPENLEYEQRLSDDQVARELSIRCPDCNAVGRLVDQPGPRYAAACRTHGRYTRWYDRNVDVLTAPVVSRARLKRGE